MANTRIGGPPKEGGRCAPRSPHTNGALVPQLHACGRHGSSLVGQRPEPRPRRGGAGLWTKRLLSHPQMCTGISGKSQLLFTLTYITRYLDLLTNFVSVYKHVDEVFLHWNFRRDSVLDLHEVKATYDFES